MYRIGRNGQESAVDVDQVEAIERVIRSSRPGRYHVDKIGADPLPSGHTARRWGIGIKRHKGTVAIEPDPWPRDDFLKHPAVVSASTLAAGFVFAARLHVKRRHTTIGLPDPI